MRFVVFKKFFKNSNFFKLKNLLNFCSKKYTAMIKIYDLSVKTEKTNPCFLRLNDSLKLQKLGKCGKKNKYSKLKKDDLFFLFWDNERKLVRISFKKKPSFLGFFLPTKIFFFLETFFKKKPGNILLNRSKESFPSQFGFYLSECSLSFTDFLFLISIESSGYMMHRFCFKETQLLKPKIFCFSMKKHSKFLISILEYNHTSGVYPSFLLSLTIIKLKPGLLKFIVRGKTCVLTFSIDTGFHSSCPVFFLKEKKRKKTDSNHSKLLILEREKTLFLSVQEIG